MDLGIPKEKIIVGKPA